MASRLLPVLALLLRAAPVWADHGGPLASAPMSAVTAALLMGGLALIAVLLVVVIVRLLARPSRGPE